jgi:hypothetical protein
MKIQLPLLIFLLVNPAFRSLGQNEIGLAPWFGDGMVLQRSANTLLQGSGPPGKTLEFSLWRGSRSWPNRPRLTTTTNVDASGHWRLMIDLSLDEFQTRGQPWLLRIEEKKSKSRKEYQNIIIGDVIIVAGWEKQGSTAGTPDFVFGTCATFPEEKKKAIRFLDLTDTNLVEDFKHAPGNRWENWPKDMSEFKRYSTLQIKLAYKLSESKIPELSSDQYIGIVLERRKVLENALGPALFSTANEFKPRDTNIWQWIADDALKAQTNRSIKLFQNKRHNIVSNIPPIIAYDAARLCSWNDFDANKAPREWFSFAGAIWSAPPPEK